MTFFSFIVSCQSTKKNGVLSERRQARLQKRTAKRAPPNKKKNHQIKNITRKHLKHIVLITASMAKWQHFVRGRWSWRNDSTMFNKTEVKCNNFLACSAFENTKHLPDVRLFYLSLEEQQTLTFGYTLLSWNFFSCRWMVSLTLEAVCSI